MADENQQFAEKSFEPTAKRKQKAKESGDVPRSKELTNVFVCFFGVFAITILAVPLINAIKSIVEKSIMLLVNMQSLEKTGISSIVWDWIWSIFLNLLPILMFLAGASIIGGISLGGFVWSASLLQPKWERISPLAGVKRLFSADKLLELIKSMIKVGVLLGVAIFLCIATFPKLIDLGALPAPVAIYKSVDLLMMMALFISSAFGVFALIDAPYQWMRHKEKLKMSIQEIKDEHKETEASPETRQRQKQQQALLSKQRMMQMLPKASVVITNPSHYAIALQYDSTHKGAPVVLAKGLDFLAEKIKSEAKNLKIPVVEAPCLARSLYYHSPLFQQIPEGLYVAVAKVLAYVFQLNQYQKNSKQAPVFKWQDELVPKELQVNVELMSLE